MVFSFLRNNVVGELLGFNQEIEYYRNLSQRDDLTGLYNRRYFDKRFLEELELCKEDKKRDLGLIILDIDFFKKINDNYGHYFGDLVLKGVGEYLLNKGRNLSSGRNFDVPCRYGGEEITIILPETSLEGSIVAAQRYLQGVRNLKFSDEESEAQITASFGVSSLRYLIDEGLVDSFYLVEKVSDILFRTADDAVYRAKETGRNQVVYEGQKIKNEFFKRVRTKYFNYINNS